MNGFHYKTNHHYHYMTMKTDLNIYRINNIIIQIILNHSQLNLFYHYYKYHDANLCTASTLPASPTLTPTHQIPSYSILYHMIYVFSQLINSYQWCLQNQLMFDINVSVEFVFICFSSSCI